MNLKNKIAIITGSGRGIGRNVGLALAKEGCKVVLVSRTVGELEKTKKEIIDSGGNAIFIVADLTKKEDIEKIIQRTLTEYRRIDILINNAAVLFSSPFHEITEEQWDTTMDTNLKAVFFLSQKVLEIMKNQKSGYIINVSSTAALCVPPSNAVYGISKLGLVGLSQAMYEIGKEYGVKVSTIYPGMTGTKMLRDFNPPVDPENWMLPEDITSCVLFLLKQSERVVVKDMVPWAARYDKI